jgi:DNA-directed RNA polymerase II subunit RPB11
MDEPELTIKRALESYDKYKGSQLQLIFEGTSVDYCLMNTLRQLVYSEIPIYAFSRSSITFDEENGNSSISDSDQLRIRFQMIPIPNVKNTIQFLESEYYPYVNTITGPLLPDREYKRDPKDDQDIYYYLNVENKNSEILNVTTNDVKITINGKVVKNLYNKPRLLVKLKKGQIVNCSMKAVLGIAKLHDCWAAISQCSYGQIKNNNYVFVIKSLGQRSEWDCLITACHIITKKIVKLRDNIKKSYTKEKIGKVAFLVIKIEEEDHMLGNLLQTTLLKHPKVTFAGYKIDHPFEPEVTLCIGAPSPLDALYDAFEYIIKLFEYVKKKLEAAEKVKFELNKQIIQIKEQNPPTKYEFSKDMKEKIKEGLIERSGKSSVQGRQRGVKKSTRGKKKL